MSVKVKQDATISDFYCVQCGRKGIPLPRIGRQREAGHLKKIWCPFCKQETNHVEIRPFGTYTLDDFEEEIALGRFIGDERVSLEDLIGCSNANCQFNREKKCWNANNSYNCIYKRKENNE